VVIAIISILAGMLLPALEQALGSARKATCLNNQKQLHLSFVGYCDDYDGAFPTVSNWTNSGSGNAWGYSLTDNAEGPCSTPTGWYVLLTLDSTPNGRSGFPYHSLSLAYVSLEIMQCPAMDRQSAYDGIRNSTTSMPRQKLDYDYGYNSYDTSNGLSRPPRMSTARVKRPLLTDGAYQRRYGTTGELYMKSGENGGASCRGPG